MPVLRYSELWVLLDFKLWEVVGRDHVWLWAIMGYSGEDQAGSWHHVHKHLSDQ